MKIPRKISTTNPSTSRSYPLGRIGSRGGSGTTGSSGGPSGSRSSSSNNHSDNNNNSRSNTEAMMMTKQKATMADRLNIGSEVRELKLGCTFNSNNTTSAFHTIKYDFKPASVDVNRVADVDIGSNNQVTVTVPNLESSCVPHTVYKGNQKEYTKEYIIIFDKNTGDMTLEKLNHNIQVKNTRIEVTRKTVGPAPKLEKSIMRVSSASASSIANLSSSLSASCHNNSGDFHVPQQQQQQNQTKTQSHYNQQPPQQQQQQQQQKHHNQQHQQQQQQSQQQLQHQQRMQQQSPSQQQYHNQNNRMYQNSSSNNSNVIGMAVIGSNSSNNCRPSSSSNIINGYQTAEQVLASAEAELVQEIGVLSSSESSTDTDSSASDSGSDSDDSNEGYSQNSRPNLQGTIPPQQQQSQQQSSGYANGDYPNNLHDDLQLSESSDDDDY